MLKTQPKKKNLLHLINELSQVAGDEMGVTVRRKTWKTVASLLKLFRMQHGIDTPCNTPVPWGTHPPVWCTGIQKLRKVVGFLQAAQMVSGYLRAERTVSFLTQCYLPLHNLTGHSQGRPRGWKQTHSHILRNWFHVGNNLEALDIGKPQSFFCLIFQEEISQ